MDNKGETFGCLVGILSAVIFTIGILICIFSRFLCIELDYTEEQRNACEIKSVFMLLFGFLVIIASIILMCFSSKILGLFTQNTDKTK